MWQIIFDPGAANLKLRYCIIDILDCQYEFECTVMPFITVTLFTWMNY
jgi:hypothetical protein